jgi:hypothetical protein
MGAMLADVPGSWSYGRARGLRASAPAAESIVPSVTGRKRKALIASLFWRAIEDISPHRGGSQQGHKYCRCCYYCKLTHGRLPQFCSRTTFVVALILHKKHILKKININVKLM